MVMLCGQTDSRHWGGGSFKRRSIHQDSYQVPLPKTNIAPEMDGWKTTFLFWKAYFQGRTVSFRECTLWNPVFWSWMQPDMMDMFVHVTMFSNFQVTGKQGEMHHLATPLVAARGIAWRELRSLSSEIKSWSFTIGNDFPLKIIFLFPRWDMWSFPGE